MKQKDEAIAASQTIDQTPINWSYSHQQLAQAQNDKPLYAHVSPATPKKVLCRENTIRKGHCRENMRLNAT